MEKQTPVSTMDSTHGFKGTVHPKRTIYNHSVLNLLLTYIYNTLLGYSYI